jgi:thiamine-monophosphate kinase
MPGEFDFISWVRSQQRASDLVQLAAGDDLAILNWKPDDLLLVGTDQVLDGVHFDSSVHSPRQIGRKAMNRNLSDCAAMACLPAAAVATVALPLGTAMEYAKELYLGMKEAADKFDCPIVGGDTASWSGKLAVSVSILGRSASVTPVTRKGARPGDTIYVTGALGGSRLGRHMSFSPRVREAYALAKTGHVTSMIDISDGLSRDLRHICDESGVGAAIASVGIPVHADAVQMSRDGHTALEHALHDGEDHELLFTWACGTHVHPRNMSFPDSDQPPTRVSRIGVITAGRDVIIEHDGKYTPLEPRGWEHTF